MYDILLEDKRQKYIDKLSSYTRDNREIDTFMPDELRYDVQQIKGDLSLDELGKLCGVNKSSLSRLLSGKTTKSINNRMLAGLAAAADSIPECGVTFQDLVKANGMITRTSERRNRSRTLEEKCRDLIFDSLINEGNSVKISNIDSPNNYDLLIETDAIKGKWGFEMCLIDPTAPKKKRNLSLSKVSAQRHITQMLADMYIHHEDVAKTSLVLNDIDLMEWVFSEYLAQITFHDALSVILMDPFFKFINSETTVLCEPIFN